MYETAKSAFADRLGVTKARVSQWLAEGMPAQPDGRLNALTALQWLADNLDREKGRKTLALVQAELGELHFKRVVQGAASRAIQEIPAAVILAAAHAGIPRDVAEKLADLAPVFVAQAVNDELAQGGVAEVDLDHPDAWRRRINWPALFDAEGRSRMAGSAAA